MTDLRNIRCECVVIGHVQGVGYRYFVLKNARQLNLKGFAKNLWDGNVQVVAEGEKENIYSLIDALKQGPSRSYVEKVEFEILDFRGDFNDFSIL